MSAAEHLEDALRRMEHLPSATGSDPADAWLLAALGDVAGPAETPDDVELAAFADGTLDAEGTARVERALLHDADLRRSYALFADALLALEEAEEEAEVEDTAPEPAGLRVVGGGASRPFRRVHPGLAAGLALAAALVFGLMQVLQPPPPIDARLLVMDVGPKVRGIPSLPPGSDTVRIVAQVPDEAWWAVLLARPGDAREGARLTVAQAPRTGADSPRHERSHVLFEGAAPQEAGELTYLVLVSEEPLTDLDQVRQDALRRIRDLNPTGEEFGRTVRDQVAAHAEGQPWRVSKTVHVAIRGL